MESILIITDKGPFGSNTSIEAIRLGAGYLGLGEDIECSLLLCEDAVICLKKNLQPEMIGLDSFNEGIEMAELTELPLIVVKEDLEKRGISYEELIEYEGIEIIPKNQISQLIEKYPLSFHM